MTPLLGLDVVRADVLGDAAGFAGGHLGAADVVEQRGLAVVDVAHDRDHRRTRGSCRPAVSSTWASSASSASSATAAHDGVAEFLGHQRGGVEIDRLGDRRHDAHLEQRLDHVAALQRELLREVGHGDRVADRDFTHDRRGRAREPVRTATGTRLVGVATRGLGLPRALVVRRARSEALRCIWPAKRLVRSSSSTPATIACEPRVLCLRVGGARRFDARRRPASDGRGRGSAAGLRAASRLRSATSAGVGQRPAWPARPWRAGLLGFAARSRGSRRRGAGRRRPASAARRGCAAWIPRACAGCRRARRSATSRCVFGSISVTFLRTTTSTVARFLPPPTVSSCLRLRLSVIFFGASPSVGRLVGLAVGALEEAEQLDFLDAGHGLVGAAEAHAGLGQLLQQLLDRRVHQFGELADGGLLRHSDSVSCWRGTHPARDGAIVGRVQPAGQRGGPRPAYSGLLTRTSACALP